MSVAYTDSLQSSHVSEQHSTLQIIKAYVALTKPGIVALMLFTAYFAAIVAQRGLPKLLLTGALLVGLALSAGGAAAINMWYDRDIDKIMKRTSHRPIPAGLVNPQSAFWFGMILEIASLVELAAFVNSLTALLSLAGFLYYAVVYTMWLKRRTPQNIVIGGGAGAIPPLMGWSAVTGHLSLAAMIMFAVIFLWTPAHFWSLALFKNEDYVRAGIPMMPVVKGPRTTKRLSVYYSILLLAVSLSLYLTGTVGMLYLFAAGFTGAMFLVFNLYMWRENDQVFVWARRTFFCSLFYLPVLFAFMVIGMAR